MEPIYPDILSSVLIEAKYKELIDFLMCYGLLKRKNFL